jgi:hypothetical protein
LCFDSPDTASTRTQQKTQLPTGLLFLHDVTIGADRINTASHYFSIVACTTVATLTSVSYSIVMSLFIVPQSGNGRVFWLHYSGFRGHATILLELILRHTYFSSQNEKVHIKVFYGKYKLTTQRWN